MKFQYDGNEYDIIVEKKRTTRNLYIRVTKDLKVKVTTNSFSSNRLIQNTIQDNYLKICHMIDIQLEKKENNSGFHYLGNSYEIIYTNIGTISFQGNTVYVNRDFDIDQFYKKEAKKLFLERLEYWHMNFSRKVSHPSLRIRKMTSRWGVCNVNTHVITLNLELMKRDISYLDYVIVHELSHLVYGDHSSSFWKVVSENIPNYKKYRDEMKVF